jgi:hypothetical protein
MPVRPMITVATCRIMRGVDLRFLAILRNIDTEDRIASGEHKTEKDTKTIVVFGNCFMNIGQVSTTHKTVITDHLTLPWLPTVLSEAAGTSRSMAPQIYPRRKDPL